MICCATLLLLVAWLQQVYGGSPPATAGPTPGWQIGGAFLAWGAAIAGLAYLALVAMLIGTGIAAHVDGTVVCVTGASGALLPVPEAMVADRWLLRSAVLLAAALLAAAAGIRWLLRAPPGALLAPRPGLVMIGAGVAWLAFSVADHRIFGLYAVPAGPALAATAIHAAGIVLVILGLRRERLTPRGRPDLPAHTAPDG